MSDVDGVTIRPRDPANAGADTGSPSFADSARRSRTKAFSRDGAMKRDRSRESHDDSRGRGRPQHGRRGYASSTQPRPRSSSSGFRSSKYQGARDKKHHGDEAYRDDGERRVDERRRSRSSDHHDHHFDDVNRGKKSPTRNSVAESRKRRDETPSPRHHPKPHDYSEYVRDRSFSPPSRKRPRSRSPLPFPSSRSKRSKRDRDRDRRRRLEREERFDREHAKGHGSSRPDHILSPSRRPSTSPRYRRYPDRGDHLNETRPRRRSRSPPWEANVDDRSTKPTRPLIDSKSRDFSHSPRPTSRRSSFSHTYSPSRSTGRHPPRGPSEAGVQSRPGSPSFDLSRPDYPPRSPKDRGSRRSRKKAKYRDEPRIPSGGPLASGANSIEVSTFRRTDRRGSFDVSEPSRDTGPRRFDDFPQGPTAQQVNADSPHYNSPGSPQPLAIAKSNKSIDTHYPHRSHQSRDRSHAFPKGPVGRQRSSQSPPHPPTGPMALTNSRGRGFSRGGFRGGMSSARGGFNDYTSAKHNQWPVSSDSITDALGSPSRDLPVHSSVSNTKDEDEEEDNIPKQPQENPADEEVFKDDKSASGQEPCPQPPLVAPTGPAANSKFSFAFKTSTKNPVTAPKPEISQKFSAALKKETQPILDARDRDLPKDTPREPASARARTEYHHSRAPPPEQPRTRKVMKTRRKLKPKPPLDAELAQSTSVYFRKPGNESVVGSGTYGKVFKGKHVYTQKLVALKRIRMEGERDGFPVTAMREVKLLQSLRHDNIVDLHEVMIERNECYMVFEYLSHDLTGLLNHPTYKLDAAQKKHLAMQLFEGLDYLHKRGVLHRDIKAANILVSSDGILKLADFGLARFYAKRHQLDYTNRVITIWYRSPELLLGETRYGAAVDIWSAACVMVEIFTRHAIFPGDGGEISQLEKIYNVLGTPNRKEWPGLADTPWFELLRPDYRKPNVFADKYRDRVPPAAFDLLAEMFKYDPAKRPSAAGVLEHPYFTTEQPPPRQAVELKEIKGDWHEFESKALRREKEKQEKQQREARRAAASRDGGQDKERKRPPSGSEVHPESKRPHLEGQVSSLSGEPSSTALPPATEIAAE
ncbi:Pkinase-domain-containing protein [Xylaria bambusicola]|uniref:Pkinase-domain-containing protein n=1 Tax=Xylaria bambusicola TaxID=326684 RepID=UPI002008C2C6|nr:Pkinase-domain-containing protein [Xylaria bambusicola]KAI0525574.1 Pkinase-domain-containing protein [Xylaria bambusicola]